MTLEHVVTQMRTAQNLWQQTLAQHRLAPPDDGFSARLLDQSGACRKLQISYAAGAETPGLGWTPLPHADRREPPPETRPDSGRRGPEALWAKHDATIEALSAAFEGTSLKAISDAFGDLADVLYALGTAVAEEDGDTGIIRTGS